MKDQNQLQAMNKGLLKHTVVLVLRQSSIQTRNRTHDQGLDMLLMYDLDVFYLSILAVEEMLAVLGVCVSFSPCGIRILVLEETLPIILKVDSKA